MKTMRKICRNSQSQKTGPREKWSGNKRSARHNTKLYHIRWELSSQLALLEGGDLVLHAHPEKKNKKIKKRGREKKVKKKKLPQNSEPEGEGKTKARCLPKKGRHCPSLLKTLHAARSFCSLLTARDTWAASDKKYFFKLSINQQ